MSMATNLRNKGTPNNVKIISGRIFRVIDSVSDHTELHDNGKPIVRYVVC